MASAVNVTAHRLAVIRLGHWAMRERVRNRHAGATRPMLISCDKSRKRSTVRLFRDAGSSDAASGLEPIADARGAREAHADTASVHDTLVDAACQRGVRAEAGVPAAGASGRFAPRSRPVRHGFGGRSTNSRVRHLNACVMSFSRLSFRESRKCFRTDPRRVRCPPSSELTTGASGSTSRIASSDSITLCEARAVELYPKRIRARAVAIRRELDQAARDPAEDFRKDP
jgi:hypothetical protein